LLSEIGNCLSRRGERRCRHPGSNFQKADWLHCRHTEPGSSRGVRPQSTALSERVVPAGEKASPRRSSVSRLVVLPGDSLMSESGDEGQVASEPCIPRQTRGRSSTGQHAFLRSPHSRVATPLLAIQEIAPRVPGRGNAHETAVVGRAVGQEEGPPGRTFPKRLSP
jgi:hypothetical protein